MNNLTPTQRRRFKTLIEQGRQHYRAMGTILKEIRDDELYLEKYESFEKFAKCEFDVSARRAYQLIEHLEVRTIVHTAPTFLDASELKESHTRAVSSVPDDKKVEVLETAKLKADELEKPLTASIIKKTAAEFFEAETTDEVEADDVVAEPNEVDPVSNAVAAKEVLNHINAAKRLIRAIERKVGCEMLVGQANSICHDLDIAKGNIVMCLPHATCPRCKGKPDGCTSCGNLGWVTKHTLGELNG